MPTDAKRFNEELRRARSDLEAHRFKRGVAHLSNALSFVDPSERPGALANQVAELAEWVEQTASGDDQAAASDVRRRASGWVADTTGVVISPDEAASRIVGQRHEAIAASRRTRDVASSRTFEYSILDLDAAAATTLGEAGTLGWELVSVTPLPDDRARFYLKREVWVQREADGGVRAAAPALGRGAAAAAAAGGGGFFVAGYAESGLDLDADGDVDGGLMDSINELFE
jgi:hypothetical protein